MTAKQQEQMPDELWFDISDKEDWVPYHGPWRDECIKYVRADLCAPTDKEKEEWIKAAPHETYEGLKTQFMALKSMVNTMGQQLSFYRKRDYQTGEAHLKSLQESLESERAMNAQLTEELSSREAQLLECIRDLDMVLRVWTKGEKTVAQDSHAAIIEEANK